MNRFKSLAFVCSVAILAFGSLPGCGKAPSNDTAATTTATTTGNPSPSTAAVTQAASNYLDAVLKGDIQRAGACLSPQAMQRIIASGKPFAPPGMKNATFRVSEVRTPSVDKAVVACVLTDSSNGTPKSEDVCCLLRLVENEWRITGMAAYEGPNQNGVLLDFETGQSMPIPRMQTSPNTAGQPTTTPPGSTTLPPRVAQEPGATSPYQAR